MPSTELNEVRRPPATSTTASLQGGLEIVPGYRLVRPRGKGAFGEVWEATGPGGIRLALKILPVHASGSTSELRALELVKDIRHPHLLAFFGYWQLNNWLVIAMELADCTLLHRLTACRQQGLPGIPSDELRGYVHDAAQGIDFLNEARHTLDGKARAAIQHRDIKPANLLLVGGRVKVGDFGLAKLLDQSVATHSGTMTTSYAAPECFHNQTTHFSDQYSLAITYCQLRANRLPFEGSPAAVMAGHLQNPPDLTMLPDAERPIVARALAKNPEERWPSCRAFVVGLPRMSDSSATPPVDAERARVLNLATQVDLLAAVGLPTELAPGGSTTSRETANPGTESRNPGTQFRPKVTIRLLGLLFAVVFFAWLAWSDTFRAPGNIDKAKQVQKDGGRGANPTIDKGKSEGVKPETQSFENSIGMKFVYIPPGKFMMGSPKNELGRGDNESHKELAITEGYWLGKYEVTQEEYMSIMGENPSYFKDAKLPVEAVSWENATAFCKKLSAKEGKTYRLPTEPEWEYACRAGTTTSFHFGETISTDQANFDGERTFGNTKKGVARGKTTAVGSFAPNAWGLHDMHGNVWERCKEVYDMETWSEPFRVLRGGSWINDAGYVRAACRVTHYWSEIRGNNHIGFRVFLESPLGKNKQVNMELVYIPPGKFLMGSPKNELERGGDEFQHEVAITKGFHLGKYEVTQEEYEAVMGENPSHFKGARLPVERVSWEDAKAFCKKLSAKEGKTYRLPTQAEWEYACRAGTTTPFHFGETISTDQANYDGDAVYGNGQKGIRRGKTTKVGSFAANAWGLYDMHGNVMELCEDEYKPTYAVRGGAWILDPRRCRSAARDNSPEYLCVYIGFRVLLSSDR